MNEIFGLITFVCLKKSNGCRRSCCLFLFVYYIKCTYLVISVYIIHCNISTSLSASVYYLAASQNKYNQTLSTADNGLIWKDDGVYYFYM